MELILKRYGAQLLPLKEYRALRCRDMRKYRANTKGQLYTLRQNIRSRLPEISSQVIARKKDKRHTPEGWSQYTLVKLRSRAKKAGQEFNLTANDIRVPETCPVFGRKLILGLERTGRLAPDIPSVDRFDNTKGYTKDNVRVISLRANMLKSDATITEIEQLLRYMKGDPNGTSD